MTLTNLPATVPAADGSLLVVNLDRRDDIAIIELWLRSQDRSPNTLRAFRHEMYRWLSWLVYNRVTHRGSTQGLWLNQADLLDSTAFSKWLRRPTRLPEWALVPVGNSLRQPIEKALVKSSHARALTVVSSFYRIICQTPIQGHRFEANPFVNQKSLSSGVRKSAVEPHAKALTDFDREYVNRALAEIAETKQRNAYQLRWIWIALSLTGLRRDELARAEAGMMVYKQDDLRQWGWILQVVGKGEVHADVPLNDQFMAEFAIYRAHFNLPPLPTPTDDGFPETTPLVLPGRLLRKEKKVVFRHCDGNLIYRAVKTLMAVAAALASADGDPAAARRLETFASHSARHTFVTRIVLATNDITIAKDAARHGSITTTQRYVAKTTSRSRKAIDTLADFPSAPPASGEA